MTSHTRAGILGAGYISDYHIEGLIAAGAKVVSVCSRCEQKAAAKAAQHGIDHHCTDPDELLARSDIDLVVIATPDSTHEALAVAAAKAGKAILLQKPMARSSAEAARIVDTANQASVPLIVSFMHRYFEEVVAARDLLAKGTLGDVHMLRQRNATPGADWAGWFYDSAESGGVVMQLGVHGIDLVRFLFGEIEAVKGAASSAKSVRMLANGTTVKPDNEDLAIATYRLHSGVLVTHEMSYREAAGTDRFRMEIYGARGTAWLRTELGALALCIPAESHEWTVLSLPETTLGLRHHEHVLAMIRGESPVDSSAEDGIASLLVAEAIYRSAQSGDWTPVETA
jgi:myo-inositol 2-dehydrogenase/D-chiro-inositol 1-dehydrogenase